MQKWEYKTESIMVEEDYSDLPFAPTSWPTPKPDKTKLYQLGNEGWELVQIVNGVAYFKRPIDEAARNCELDESCWPEEEIEKHFDVIDYIGETRVLAFKQGRGKQSVKSDD